MFHLRLILIATICFISKVQAGYIQFHHGVGLGAAYQSSLGGLAKYNGRLNLYYNETWSVSVSGTPNLGAEINRPDQDAFRPFFTLPMTADFNWGMGSSRDCLRYRGYSVKLGLSPSSFATTQKEIINPNIKSVPAYLGLDYKIQTEKLKTFSFELGFLFAQSNDSYLSPLGVLFSLNHLLGKY